MEKKLYGYNKGEKRVLPDGTFWAEITPFHWNEALKGAQDNIGIPLIPAPPKGKCIKFLEENYLVEGKVGVHYAIVDCE